ncbi:MAG: family 43 glycosylhydrolase [Marinilabiliales bacterium]|nr:family 43 glycosylhydrolase [Marinilabiliales bacterium]
MMIAKGLDGRTTHKRSPRRMAVWFLLCLTLMMTEQIRVFGQPSGTYLNPVLAGDYPDPSIIRVGADYYMTHSSFDYYPGLLILHSRDLVHWERITHALHKVVGSVWAPDLVCHEGVFYIYFPAGGTNWVVWSRSPAGPWSDPMDLKLPGFIDPGHLVGPDGKRYLYLSHGAIVQLTDDGLATTGLPIDIYKGWDFPGSWSTECFCLESPKATVRNGFYYLTTAEGGTAGPATSHMVVSARANHPLGPYQNSPYNPIVHTADRSQRWWSQGHGSLVEDSQGKWWMLYHGYEKGYHLLGRQTLMLPIEWTADNWYKVPDGVTSENPVKAPVGTSVDGNMDLSDHFGGSQPGIQWQFFKRYRPERVSVDNGTLSLKGEGSSFDDSSPLLVNSGEQAYEITVEYELGDNVTAGLTLFYNETAHVRIAVDTARVAVFIQKGAKIREPNFAGRHGFLRILNDRNEVSFYLSKEGHDWHRVERSLDITGYNHNVFGQFLSLRAGLFAFGTGTVGFRNFQYKPLERK